MNMPSSGVIRSMVLAIALSCAAGRFVGQTPNEPDIRAAQSAPRRQGFFDYALGKVNPQDKDYGASIESGAECNRRIHDRRSLLLVECGDAAFAQRAGRHRSLCSGALWTSAN